MPRFLNSRWILFLVLAVFILCKIPHLFYPYYWDESWPYATAIKELYNHGISLMPNAIDAEISRGHPLFFHVLAVAWMHIFGSSHVAMHSFALSISVLFLITIYEVGLRLFNQRVAVISLIAAATQVMFFVQSSMVLMEVLVAFLAFLSLYFYSKDKYSLTIICLTALFYTKESGLVVGMVLGIDAVIGLFNKQNDNKTRFLRFASVAVPCLLIGVYFIIQKQVNGWYIFPFYQGRIVHDWDSFYYIFRLGVLVDVFDTSFRNWYFITLMVVSIIAAVKNRNFRFGTVFLTGFIVYCFVDNHRPGRILPAIPFFAVFITSCFYLLKVYSSPAFFSGIQQRRFIRLTGIFIVCFLCFCPLNFYIYRYLLAAIVPLLFLSAVFFDLLLNYLFGKLYYPLLTFILVLGFFAFKTNDGWGDCDLGAFDAMDVHQAVVDYLEQNNCYNKHIGCGAYIELQHLINPATGFLHSEKVFKNVKWDINKETDYAVFDAMEADPRYEAIKKDTSFHRVFRFEKGKSWAEIYGRQ